MTVSTNLMMQNRFHVKFWGVRGSIPCPGSHTVRYGGNTSCVEMQVGTERLIFDGGTLHPNFPVPLQIMQGDLQFYDIEIGETIQIEDITVETARLNHPGEAVGYRINWRGLSAAFITDTEHHEPSHDDDFLDKIGEEVCCSFSQTVLAREGLSIELRGDG